MEKGGVDMGFIGLFKMLKYGKKKTKLRRKLEKMPLDQIEYEIVKEQDRQAWKNDFKNNWD